MCIISKRMRAAPARCCAANLNLQEGYYQYNGQDFIPVGTVCHEETLGERPPPVDASWHCLTVAAASPSAPFLTRLSAVLPLPPACRRLCQLDQHPGGHP